MLKIGITGGIGSGKSTICRIFEVLGISVFYADSVAKSIMDTDPALVEKIKDLFGKEAYDEHQQLNRKYISNIVFNDQKQLEALNELVHPATIQAFDEWSLKQGSPYVMKEAAILYESNAYKKVDRSILVVSPEALRISRVMKRDGTSAEHVKTRMRKQLSDEEKRKFADYIIINDEKNALIPQVLHMHNEFLKMVI